jgi:hypothetical protein
LHHKLELIMSQFAITTLTTDQWDFLKEKCVNMNVQTKNLDRRTLIGALNRAFYVRFSFDPPEAVVDVSMITILFDNLCKANS